MDDVFSLVTWDAVPQRELGIQKFMFDYFWAFVPNLELPRTEIRIKIRDLFRTILIFIHVFIIDIAISCQYWVCTLTANK